MFNRHTPGQIQGNAQHDDIIANGDFSAWEHLTAAFDNEQMLSNNSEEPMDKPQIDSLDVSIGEFPDIYKDGRERGIHSSSYPDLVRVKQRLHNSLNNILLPAAVTSCQNNQQQFDPTTKMVRSWSHPMLNPAEITTSYPIERHYGGKCSYNLTNMPHQITDHPIQWSVPLSETPECFRRTTRRSDNNEQNYQSSNHITTNQSFSTSLYVNCSGDGTMQDHWKPSDKMYFNSTSLNPSLTKIVAQRNYLTNMDSQVGTIWKTLHSEPASKKLKHTPQHAIEDHNLTKTDKAMFLASVDTLNTHSRRSVKAPKNRNVCFSPVEEEAIRSWMKLQQLSSVPPYQQFLNKKLLLLPLTPYNYFFRDERENIVSQISNETDPLPRPVSEISVSKLQYLLKQHWFIDPIKKKRQHRKTHGKIDFQRLSKVIAERWHQLPNRVREFYRSVARCDASYYRQQLDLIKERPDIT